MCIVKDEEGITVFQGSWEECEQWISEQEAPHMYQNKTF